MHFSDQGQLSILVIASTCVIDCIGAISEKNMLAVLSGTIIHDERGFAVDVQEEVRLHNIICQVDEQAAGARKPEIFHSDQICQFAYADFASRPQSARIRIIC